MFPGVKLSQKTFTLIHFNDNTVAPVAPSVMYRYHFLNNNHNVNLINASGLVPKPKSQVEEAGEVI